MKQAKDLRETLVEKLKIATESTLSAEERAARMDELLEDEDKRQKEIDYQLKYLRDMQFKKIQELHDNKVQERNTEAEIQVNVNVFRINPEFRIMRLTFHRKSAS